MGVHAAGPEHLAVPAVRRRTATCGGRSLTAYITRGDHGDAYDNKAVLTRIAALRAERAQLLGYASHADFVLEENMAKTPDQVYGLLNRLWEPALAMAAREAAALQEVVKAEGGDFTLEPWDWRYYTEKVQQGALRPRRTGPAARTSRWTACAKARSTWPPGSTA